MISMLLMLEQLSMLDDISIQIIKFYIFTIWGLSSFEAQVIGPRALEVWTPLSVQYINLIKLCVIFIGISREREATRNSKQISCLMSRRTLSAQWEGRGGEGRLQLHHTQLDNCSSIGLESNL